MENFNFFIPTKMLFGRGKVSSLPAEMLPYGRKVLLVYGGGSIKKNGIYDTVTKLLTENSLEYRELSGVTPNPKIESVREGIEIARSFGAEMVLAVGGGSTLDCSKVIAAGTLYDGDAWDLVMDGGKIKGALPIFSVLTMSATGSEMNHKAVISDMTTHIKKGTASSLLFPKASVLDPTYLYSLPRMQTAAGIADIMSHTFEGYFNRTDDAYVQDKFAEGILKTCIKWGPIALTEPENYTARANIMWAASMALNGLTGCGKTGKWSCHAIQHQLGAYYDITHGIGLAIITPAWMRYIINKDETAIPNFVDYAVNVWGFPRGKNDYMTANLGIDATEKFFADCGIPMTLSELGIDETYFRPMAEAAVPYASLDSQAFVKLTVEDVIHIYENSL